MHAATILTSSFLLFLVQPMIARRILPAFGGSTAVWTTCMLFFQVLLLAGYWYADRIARRRAGGFLHAAFLLAGVASLPVALAVEPTRWASLSADPTWSVLGVLAVTVGVPYFLLSTTGPLIQAWFSRKHPGKVPYRLFSLSNIGSFAGLLSYPLVIEPAVGVTIQLRAWCVGFVCFAALCGYLAWRSGRYDPVAAEHGNSEPPGRGEQALWVVFAASASALLLR